MPKEDFNYIVYIDEAGDEGFGKLRAENRSGQSKWFLLGAVVVRKENDNHFPKWRNEILERFPHRNAQKRDLHFRDLKHEQKIVTVQMIAELPIRYCIIFSNKETLLGTRLEQTFKEPGHLYNFMTRWLLERVTEFCRNDAIQRKTEANLKVVFSRRGNTNYQNMVEYLELMRDGKEKLPPPRSIHWDVFSPNNIAVENHKKWAGLQISDVCTSAFYKAVEPNLYGNIDTAYAEAIRHLAMKVNGHSLNYGITPIPSLNGCDATKSTYKFFESFKK